jgi:hypothetical protein
MISAPLRKRANYMSDEVGEDDFHLSFTKFMTKAQANARSKYLRAENTQRFKHGSQWGHPAAPQALTTDFKEHSYETSVSFEKIANHDLTAVEQVVGGLIADMERQFAQMMYSTVSAAAVSVGNVVDTPSVGSPREAFAQMLEKIEFTADKFGKVTLPEIHTHPDAAKKLQQSVAEAPPEFHQRIEEIKARKSAQALGREVERKARFVRYGDSQ